MYYFIVFSTLYIHMFLIHMHHVLWRYWHIHISIPYSTFHKVTSIFQSHFYYYVNIYIVIYIYYYISHLENHAYFVNLVWLISLNMIIHLIPFSCKDKGSYLLMSEESCNVNISQLFNSFHLLMDAQADSIMWLLWIVLQYTLIFRFYCIWMHSF